MEVGVRIHTQTWEEAMQEVCRLKQENGDTMFIYKIVESDYEGFDVLTLDPDEYVEGMVDQAMIHPDIRKPPARYYGRQKTRSSKYRDE